MAKAIFTSKISPAYDDLPEVRYHFPRTYLRQVEAALNDWVIYYEPRRATSNLSSSGGRQAYFATARVESITDDPIQADHFYAFMSHYLEFDRPVPFAEKGYYYEQVLQKDDGSTNKGAFGRAVRNISNAEYDLILHAGFAHVLGFESRYRPDDLPEEPLEPLGELFGFAEEPTSPWALDYEEAATQDRNIVQTLINRPFRDRAFASSVKSAYRDTCAITGIKIINGGGRSEVQAAHIRPVAEQGPDSLRNGIALSGTVHWMFDRGLLSVDDDYSILVARNKVPDTVTRLIREEGKLLLPSNVMEQPHKQFLKFHRDQVFKG